MTQSHTPAVEALPVVYVTAVAEGHALFMPRPSLMTESMVALTPHAPAQAQIDALRIENERLRDRLKMLRNHTSVSENQIAMIDDALKAGKETT